MPPSPQQKTAPSRFTAQAWSWPAANFAIRASYDRAFQTPAIENLLLASSPLVDVLSDSVVRLPVLPSLGKPLAEAEARAAQLAKAHRARLAAAARAQKGAKR